MLGSYEESEDLVQETFLRAWRRLYRIATNACMDALHDRPRASRALDVRWLQPSPDRLLDGVGAPDEEPEAVVVARETVEIAFLAALQLLTPSQRAALIMRDVLGASAKETASVLETSMPTANSANSAPAGP